MHGWNVEYYHTKKSITKSFIVTKTKMTLKTITQSQMFEKEHMQNQNVNQLKNENNQMIADKQHMCECMCTCTVTRNAYLSNENVYNKIISQ